MSNISPPVPNREPKPSWLKVPFPGGPRYSWIHQKVQNLALNTVCEEAHCPNIGECWNGGTATFMLMGDTCTRGCRFCAVNTQKKPGRLDLDEPQKLADTLSKMQLTYVVLTTVNRDDLADQGAAHLAQCIRTVQTANPDLLIEMLMPDFQGQMDLVDIVYEANPAVMAHNLETVERLTQKVRDRRAQYQQSLNVLQHIKQVSPEQYTKSSLMLGLGETHEEIIKAMEDLRKIGVNFLTLGQYLQPTKHHLPVQQYVHPDTFKELQDTGLAMGFEYVASGPLVRSSYKAAEFFIERQIRG